MCCVVLCNGDTWRKLCWVGCRVVVTNVPRVWYQCWQWRFQDYVSANSQSGCANLLFSQFLPKTARKWKIWIPRGGVLASPLGSANGYAALVVAHMARHPRLFVIFSPKTKALCSVRDTKTRGGSRIPRRRRHQPPPNLGFCQIFLQNAWNWENFGPTGGGRGARVGGAPTQFHHWKTVAYLGLPYQQNLVTIGSWRLPPLRRVGVPSYGEFWIMIPCKIFIFSFFYRLLTNNKPLSYHFRVNIPKLQHNFSFFESLASLPPLR